jgi:hypothetical protein
LKLKKTALIAVAAAATIRRVSSMRDSFLTMASPLSANDPAQQRRGLGEL